MAQQQINPGSPPVLWSDMAAAFDQVNDNFTELYASIGGDAVDFSSLATSLIPRTTELYDLGSSTKKWRDLYLSGSSLHLGDAVITSTGTGVNLPAGSTLAGSVIDQEYFKVISVPGQNDIVADPGGNDTLYFTAGNLGITITTDDSTDTLTISNSGVTQLSGTVGQIGVSSSTGNITLTNLGVTSIVAGFGMSVNQATGAVTVTNEGLAGLDAGIGITLSARDPITGRVTVTNSQPNIPQNVFNTISVPTQTDIVAESITDTLTIQVSGDGLSITTNALTDTLTFSNTGVHSLAVGNGLTASAGTGSINLTLDATLSRNIIGDVTGSVFADNSTRLIDGTAGTINASALSGSLPAIDGSSLTGVIADSVDWSNVANTPTTLSGYGITDAVADSDLGVFTFTGSTLDTNDSSGIIITPAVTFNSDVNIENELFIRNNRVIAINELKSIVAASTDFNDFKARIAAL
jgi:hypothetical protein